MPLTDVYMHAKHLQGMKKKQTTKTTAMTTAIAMTTREPTTTSLSTRPGRKILEQQPE